MGGQEFMVRCPDNPLILGYLCMLIADGCWDLQCAWGLRISRLLGRWGSG